MFSLGMVVLASPLRPWTHPGPPLPDLLQLAVVAPNMKAHCPHQLRAVSGSELVAGWKSSPPMPKWPSSHKRLCPSVDSHCFALNSVKPPRGMAVGRWTVMSLNTKAV